MFTTFVRVLEKLRLLKLHISSSDFSNYLRIDNKYKMNITSFLTTFFHSKTCKL